jgi:DNA-binding transcriptional LysR family regulator
MFVAAVEERSVRVAAERVFRTRLAVGIAVRKLEEACRIVVAQGGEADRLSQVDG